MTQSVTSIKSDLAGSAQRREAGNSEAGSARRWTQEPQLTAFPPGPQPGFFIPENVCYHLRSCDQDLTGGFSYLKMFATTYEAVTKTYETVTKSQKNLQSCDFVC